MFLVAMRWIGNYKDDVLVATEIKEKAEEWIEKEMESKQYSGLGYHVIQKVEIYN